MFCVFRDPSITALAISEFDELYDADLAQLQQQTGGGPQQQVTVSRQQEQGLVGAPLGGHPPLQQQWQPTTVPSAHHQVVSYPHPQPQQVQQPAPSASNLWGLRSGSKTDQQQKKPGGSLFGDRPIRGNGDVSNVFSDPKVNSLDLNLLLPCLLYFFVRLTILSIVNIPVIITSISYCTMNQ